MKKLILMGFASVLTVIGFSGIVVSADEGKELKADSITAEEYIEFLENYDIEDALASGIDKEYAQDAVDGVKDVIQAVKGLSKDDLDKFIWYQNNPEEKFKAARAKSNTDVEFRVSKEDEIQNAAAGPVYQDRYVSHTETMYVYGVQVLRAVVKGQYKIYASSVTHLVSKDAQMLNVYERNTKGVLKSVSHKITSGLYRAEAEWEMRNTITNTSQGNVKGYVTGNHIGKVAGSIY